ncbi:MAG TPA: hypothetical protein VFB90_05375, partial [Dehalococcoidia bacterium]|nr:hypothetical protein [Dehalococcoidia bacterium]
HIALELVLPYFLHGSPQQLVAVLLWVNASLLVCSLLFTRASLAVAWRWPLRLNRVRQPVIARSEELP